MPNSSQKRRDETWDILSLNALQQRLASVISKHMDDVDSADVGGVTEEGPRRLHVYYTASWFGGGLDEAALRRDLQQYFGGEQEVGYYDTEPDDFHLDVDIYLSEAEFRALEPLPPTFRTFSTEWLSPQLSGLGTHNQLSKKTQKEFVEAWLIERFNEAGVELSKKRPHWRKAKDRYGDQTAHAIEFSVSRETSMAQARKFAHEVGERLPEHRATNAVDSYLSESGRKTEIVVVLQVQPFIAIVHEMQNAIARQAQTAMGPALFGTHSEDMAEDRKTEGMVRQVTVAMQKAFPRDIEWNARDVYRGKVTIQWYLVRGDIDISSESASEMAGRNHAFAVAEFLGIAQKYITVEVFPDDKRKAHPDYSILLTLETTPRDLQDMLFEIQHAIDPGLSGSRSFGAASGRDIGDLLIAAGKDGRQDGFVNSDGDYDEWFDQVRFDDDGNVVAAPNVHAFVAAKKEEHGAWMREAWRNKDTSHTYIESLIEVGADEAQAAQVIAQYESHYAAGLAARLQEVLDEYKDEGRLHLMRSSETTGLERYRV